MLKRGIGNLPLVAVTWLLVLASCSNDVPYDQRITFPRQRWSADRVLGFAIDSLNRGAEDKYRVLLTVRSRDTFPYDTLWLCVSGVSLDRTLPRDTLAVSFADAGGNWVGGMPRRGVVERSVQLPFVVDGDGKYEIDVASCMATDTLSGILGIGIRLEKIDNRYNGR